MSVTATEDFAETAELDKFIDPVGYLSAFVSHRIRPSGKSCSAARNIKLNVGSIFSANGSAMVTFGQTSVLTAVKMELSNPILEGSSKGFLVCNIDFTPNSLPECGSGPPTSEAQCMSQHLQDVLSRFVDSESLVLLESKLCWTVFVDIAVICNSGNIWDASLLASTAALINTRVPVVHTGGESPVVDATLAQQSLKLGPIPLAASFAILSDDCCLLDPSREEELICEGSFSVVYLQDGSVSQIVHTGKPLSNKLLVSLCEDGYKHTQTLYKLLDTVTK